MRLAEQHGLPRIVSVQNPYCLIARGYYNGLDETCHHLGVSLLAYSPLAFGLLTGKYDASGFTGPDAPSGRMQMFQRLLHLPARFFDEHSAGVVISKVTYDVTQAWPT